MMARNRHNGAVTIDLADRRLYLCTPIRDDLAAFVSACVSGGVDVVQLREKHASLDAIERAGKELSRVCRDLGVPFILNDEPELALAIGADGVHVGQDDASVARCREILGTEAIVGLSTHAPEEFDLGLETAASYLSAGPIE
jgi:thiamine-phosphate pyrophosphorylase